MEGSDKALGSDAKAIPELRPEHIVINDLDSARKLLAFGDDIQRFQLQLRFDLYDRLWKQLEAGTSLYEKLILLDGAIIALSMTFLASLSSRLGLWPVKDVPFQSLLS